MKTKPERLVGRSGFVALLILLNVYCAAENLQRIAVQICRDRTLNLVLIRLSFDLNPAVRLTNSNSF